MFSRQIFWWLFLILVVANVAWWLGLQTFVDHDTGWNYWFNAAYGLPFLATCFFYLPALRKWRDEYDMDVRAVLYIGIGIFLHGMAQMVWTYYNVVLQVEVPVASIADIFYTAAILLQLVGLAFLLGHRPTTAIRPHTERVFRGVCTVVATLVAAFVIVKYVLPTEDGFLLNLNTFYTVTSFIRAFLIMLNLYREWHISLRAFFLLFLMGSTFLGLADVMYSVRTYTQEYWNGDVVDGLYMVGGLFLLAAARYLPSQIEHDEIATPPESKNNIFLRSEAVFPIAVMLFGCLLAGRVAEYTYISSQSQLQYETESEAIQIGEIIQHSVATELATLNALVGFFEGSEEVTEEEFAIFADNQFGSRSRISQLSYVNPEGVVQYATNPNSVGFDISRDGVTVGDLREAQKGEYAVSAPRVLRSGVPGVSILAPIYRNDVFVGTAALSIYLPSLMDSLRLDTNSYSFVLFADDRYISLDGESVYDSLGHRIIDREGRTESFHSFDPHVSAPISATEYIALADAEWVLTVYPSADRHQSVYTEPLSVFLTVFLVMAALAGLAFIISSQQARLRQQLHERTQDLQMRVSQLGQQKFFLDNVTDAIIAFDIHHRILYANQAAFDLFGVMGDGSHDDVWGRIFHHVEEGATSVEEELTNKKKWEGEVQMTTPQHAVRDILLSLLPLHDAEGDEEGHLLVARDITSRKEIERAKNQFVSLVSHQLRSPMTQLRWMMEQLNETPRLPASARERIEDMDKIVRAENKLVGDLLNISRIERGVLKVDLAATPVTDLLKEALDPLLSVAKERHMTLHVDRPDRSVSVHVDGEKMAEAIRNLVDNAIRYSPEHSAVWVSADTTEKRFVSISVKDQGPGIPQESWDKLFEIKTTQSTSGASTSTGLGLYITKKFVEAMGGTIVFKTSSRGTMFTVRLPRAPQHG